MNTVCRFPAPTLPFSDSFNRPNTGAGGVGNGWLDNDVGWYINNGRATMIRGAVGGDYSHSWLVRRLPAQQRYKVRMTMSMTLDIVTPIVHFQLASAESKNSFGCFYAGKTPGVGIDINFSNFSPPASFTGGGPSGAFLVSPNVGAFIQFEYWRLYPNTRDAIAVYREGESSPVAVVMQTASGPIGGWMGIGPFLNGSTVSDFSITTESPRRAVIFDGTSITADGTWQPTYQVIRGFVSECFNFAVAGQTTANMNSDFSTEIAPVISTRLAQYGSGNVVAVADTGTNDLANNDSVATLQSRITTYASSCTTAGAVIYGCTILPRTAGFSGGQDAAGFESSRLSYNSWLLANYASLGMAGVIDFGSMASMSNTLDTVYYQDQIHPTKYGGFLMGQLAATVLP